LVPGPESAALGINASATRGVDHKSADKIDKLRRASKIDLATQVDAGICESEG
jgi:hypothetical protein